MFSRASLRQDFQALGVGAGDTVMLHASVRAVGAVAGGPDEIHLALKEALTNEGTLIMYAGCPRYFDEVGRGNLTAGEEREVLEKMPPFDSRTARAAQDHGVLVEMLRTWEGSLVNDHVARFVVWGRRAEWLISEQPWDFAFGKGSALERLLEADGKVLLLGSDFDNVTFLHYVEHVADVPDKKIVRYQVPVLEHGERVWKWMAEVDTNVAPEGYFADIVSGYVRDTENAGGQVGDARAWLLSVRGLAQHARRCMERAAAK